jgi:prepilin-type N-terminal cleavage/methylation domain-containing protein
MSRTHRDDGFAMLEVMAAVTLFAVVATGLAATTIGTMKANNLSKQTTAATALIHDKMEQLRALDPSTGPADLQAGSHSDPLNPLTPTGQAAGGYTRTWTVTANTPKIGLAEIAVTVSWKSPAARSLTAATYICQTATCS